MRLYLSSFGLGNQPQKLVNLVAGHTSAAIILNAYDFATEDTRKVRLQQEIQALQQLGFHPEELDLRHYFNDKHKQLDLRTLLTTYGLVWVRGGDSFILRRAMKASGFDEILLDMLAHDAIVYGGFSAGIAMLTPSLHGVELVDNPYDVPEGYDATVIWECLGLVPYAIAPHYRSDHPESAAVDRLVQYYIDNHILFKALRDGQVLLVQGSQEQVIS